MPTIAEAFHALDSSTISSIGDLQHAILTSIQTVREADPGKEIWLVSGRVTGKNSRRTRRNEELLIDSTDYYQILHPEKIIFTSGQLMSEDLRAKVKASGATYEDFVAMWGAIVEHHMDGLFMTRNWRQSRGATKEHESAQAKGIQIYEQTIPEALWIRSLPLRRSLIKRIQDQGYLTTPDQYRLVTSRLLGTRR